VTARTEGAAMPLAPESREHLRQHRDELHSLAGTLEVTRVVLRAYAVLGAPITLDTLRLVRDAADLLTIAARKIDPDQETTRGPRRRAGPPA
jgi:glycerol dehydrogenase-like iron-containing ADH family enzyme